MSDIPADDDSLRRVADIGDVAEGDSSVIEVDSKRIALFNIDGAYYALDNVCPHRGARWGRDGSRTTACTARGTGGSSTW